MLSAAAVQDAVELLLAARGDFRRLDRFPEACTPATFDDAYAIQERFAGAFGVPVAGYKIGCTSEEAQKMLGSPGPFAGRVFAPFLLHSPAEISASAFHRIGIEAEFVFTLARDLPPRPAPYGADEVADAVAALHPGIEIVDGRWADWMKVGIHSIVADNGANGGLVIGPGTADWRKLDLPAAPVTLRFDGAVIAQGSGAAVLGNPLNALVWLANDLSRRGFGLKARDAVTTGTTTSIHFAKADTIVEVDFGVLGKAEVRIVK